MRIRLLDTAGGPRTGSGTVAALNAVLEATRASIIAIIDDDTVTRPDWLARINTHFRADPKVGGVGGRDWIHHDGKIEDGARKVVGRVQWFGRVIGNHHLGVGEPREVCVLKGVNMSYRRAAIRGIRFEGCLRGTGAQLYYEIAFGLAVKRASWKLIYDPAVAVDHYLVPRFDEDQRHRCNALALTIESYSMFHDHGQPPRPQTGQGEGADRGAGL